MRLFKNRKFRQGSAATIITIIAIVIVVVINMLAGVLTNRFSLRGDMTSENLFTLSQESKDFLGTVTKEVNIYVLNTEDYYMSSGSRYYQQVAEILHSYARQNNNISVEFIDLLKNPNFTARFPNLNLSSSEILVESGGNTVVLNAYNLFNTEIDYDTYSTYITSSKAEQTLSSAIMNVTSDSKTKVVMLDGVSGQSNTDFENLLTTNNYELVHRNILTDEIDADADIIMLNSPSRDLTEDEAKKLETFLTNGGQYDKTLLFLATISNMKEMPYLEAFLAEWGIGLGQGSVYETNSSKLFQANVFMTLADYAETEYSGSLNNTGPFAMPYARPLEVLFETRNGVQTSLLMQFSAGAGIMSEEEAQKTNPTLTASGPIPAIILSQYLTYIGTTPHISSVLACGSEYAIDANLLSSESVSNSEYWLNILASLAGREETVRIQSKTIGSTQMGITYGTALMLMVFTLILLPLATLGIGIGVWVRRRHK